MKPSHWVTHYWQAWALATFLEFLAVEVWALTVGGWQNTLSANVWRALKVQPHEQLGQHPAVWALTLGVWATTVIWLTGHFWFQWWRS